MTYQERTIDLASYKAKDLIMNRLQGGTLSIEAEGSPVVTIKGKHTELSTSYSLAVIDMTTLGTLSNITAAGIYMCPISGLDQVELEVSGTGKIHIKEIGD